MRRIVRVGIVFSMAILLFAIGYEKKVYEPPQTELDAMWEELVAFGEAHRDILNEMSEFFVDAVDQDVPYPEVDAKRWRKSFPSIEKLAEGFTDEESQIVLEKLSPYYRTDNDDFIELRYVYGHCGEYGKHNPHYYRFVYLDTDGEQLEEYLELKRNALFYWCRIYKLNEHLYAVEETGKRT